MPSRRPWIRLYTAFRTDPRIRSLTPLQAIAFVHLLCLAGESSRPGHIELAPGTPYPDRALADAINIHPRSVRKVIETLMKQGVGGLSRPDDGTLILTKWSDNQPDDPTKSERMARYRAKLAVASTPPSTSVSTSPSTETAENRVEKNRIRRDPPEIASKEPPQKMKPREWLTVLDGYRQTKATEAWAAGIESEFGDVDLPAEARRFVDWWSEGKRGLVRPRAAWRNWLLRAREYRGRDGTPGQNPATDYAADIEKQRAAGIVDI